MRGTRGFSLKKEKSKKAQIFACLFVILLLVSLTFATAYSMSDGVQLSSNSVSDEIQLPANTFLDFGVEQPSFIEKSFSVASLDNINLENINFQGVQLQGQVAVNNISIVNSYSSTTVYEKLSLRSDKNFSSFAGNQIFTSDSGCMTPESITPDNNSIGILGTTTKTCSTTNTGGCSGLSCGGTASVSCGSCSSINPSTSHLTSCTPASCSSSYPYDFGVSCSVSSSACNKCTGLVCSYKCSYQMKTCTRTCGQGPCDGYPNNPNYCGGQCYGNCASGSTGTCCNGVYSCCPSGYNMCCPSSGAAKNCCSSGMTCQSNGNCCWPNGHSCSSPATSDPSCCSGTCQQNSKCGTNTCTNQCTLGQTRCKNSNTQESCYNDGVCNVWGNAQSCNNGCSNGVCTACKSNGALCSNPATSDPSCCSGTCQQNSLCGTNTCTNQCSFGQTRCNGNVAETCTSNGICWVWGNGQSCQNGCSNGNCITCKANGVSCSSPGTSTSECCSGTCQQNGKCGTNTCTNQCSSGQTRCNGNTAESCVNNGVCWVWGNGQSCQNGCSSGACVTTTNTHGYVKDEDGNPIKNTVVKFTDCSNNDVKSTTTDSSGYFSLSTNAGNYKLKVVMPYGTITVVDGQGNSCLSFVGNVDVGTITIGIKFSLSGVVQDESGKAVKNAVAKLTDCSGNVITSSTTDSSGNFKLISKYGDYKVKITYNSVDYWITNCDTYNPGDYSFSNVIVLPSKVHIRGKIIDENNNARSGVVMQLTDCSDNLVTSSTTDSSGNFELVANPSSYKIKINLGYALLLLLVNSKECNSYGVGNIDFNPITVQKNTRIYGIIKELNGNPIKNQKIELYTCSDSFVTSSTTDSSGYYSLSASAGKYKLKLVMGDKRVVLQDSNKQSCFIFRGNVPLDLSVGIDCSQYNYYCYNTNWKLFNCYFAPDKGSCNCYYQVCSACTPGSKECDAVTGAMNINVNDLSNNPVGGAKIYIDNNFKIAADSNGKAKIYSDYGYRNVKVECPDNSPCTTKSVYVDGDEQVYFSCDCKGDSDNDGLINTDEVLMGTDPNNATENLNYVLMQSVFDSGCFNPLAIISGGLSLEERANLISVLNNSNEVTAQKISDGTITVKEILSLGNISSKKLVDNKRGAADMMRQSVFVSGIVVENDTVLLIMADKNNITAVYRFGARCIGQITGLVAGAGAGLYDDVKFVLADLPLLVVKGIWYVITIPFRLGQVVDEVKGFFSNIGSSFSNIGSAFYEMSLGIFRKAAKINFFTDNKQNYLAFQINFYNGYITGYIAEQVAMLFVGVGEIKAALSGAFKALKAGETLVKLAKPELELLAKLTQFAEVGGRAADVLRTSKIFKELKVAKWGEEAQKGLGKLAKWVDDSAELDKVVSKMNKPEEFAKKIASLSDEAGEVLGKSKYGKTALGAGWEILELEGLGKITKKLGSSAEEILARAETQYGASVIKDASKAASKYEGITKLVSGADDLKSLQYFLQAIDDAAAKLGIAADKMPSITFVDDIIFNYDSVWGICSADGSSIKIAIKKDGNLVRHNFMRKAIIPHEMSHAAIDKFIENPFTLLESKGVNLATERKYINWYTEFINDRFAIGRMTIDSTAYADLMTYYRFPVEISESYIKQLVEANDWDRLAALRNFGSEINMPSYINLVEKNIPAAKKAAFDALIEKMLTKADVEQILKISSQSERAKKLGDDLYDIFKDIRNLGG